MLVTWFGMVKLPFLPEGYAIRTDLFLLYSIPSTEVYALLSASTFIAVRAVGDVQYPDVVNLVPEKAPYPMLVTLFGMVTLVRPVPEKAPSPMLVTLLGMVTLVRLGLEKAYLAIAFVPSRNVIRVFAGILPLYRNAAFPA